MFPLFCFITCLSKGKSIEKIPYPSGKTPPPSDWNLAGSSDEKKLWLRENREYLGIIP